MTVALTLAQTLLQCLDDSLTVDRPTRICLRGGDAVRPMLSTNDDECCGGLAWVRIAGTDRADDFDFAGSFGCVNHLRRTTLEMGVVRCMPTPGPDALVECDEWSAVVALMEADHSAMETAVCCFFEQFQTVNGDPTMTVGLYEPRGPEGRCIGGTMLVEVTHGCACGTSGS